MRYCDLTLAYTATSGGIRTYIDAKRRFIRDHTEHEHVLIVPGEDDGEETEGRLSKVTIASPIIPGCAPYRWFWRPDRLTEALEAAQPDVVELGSFFVCPWAAFDYREGRTEGGHRCLVGGFFHTDLADAYFGSPLREILHDNLREWGENFARWGLGVAEAAEFRAEQYFGRMFQRCDLVFASTPKQVERLRDYGIGRARLAPLGVDLELFDPGKRDEAVRDRFGVGPDDVLIMYAGRLDAEKHVEVLVEAFEALRLPGARLLLTGEGAMRKKLEEQAEDLEGLVVAPYEGNREAFARLLASADIYATAGPHETFGLSVIEAQASGLPVVGVDAGALRERVVPGTGFLVPVDDAEAMARKLEAAAADRESLGAAARRHVVEGGFGWEGTFRTLLGAYEEVWAEKGSASRREPGE